VGAGFGGLSAARELRRAQVDVHVVDRHNYHGFWPLLYQVATGILDPQQIASPVRTLLRKQANASFVMADVRGVDLDARQLLTEREPITYDYLVLAGGSTTNFFGDEGLTSRVHALKNLDEAERVRNHLLSVIEAAARSRAPAARRALLTFVVVGGGATGVELAGQLSLLLHRTVRSELPGLDLGAARILLVSAGDSVLETFPESLRGYGKDQLERAGVEVRLGQRVRDVEAGGVVLDDGSRVPSATVIWAAGVRAGDLAQGLGIEPGPDGRIAVTPMLTLPGRPEVSVVGDMAYLEGADGCAYPMVAPVAIQQGRRAARNVIAAEAGRPPREFRYVDRGQMAIIGRRTAVVSTRGLRLRGVLAWFAWLSLHLLTLRGRRNRLVVLLDWLAVYFSPTRRAGVITRPERTNHAQPDFLPDPILASRRSRG
jgi:NADH dehydrogenase